MITIEKTRKTRSDKIPDGYVCDGPKCSNLARKSYRFCPSHLTQKSRHGEMWPLFSYRERKDTVGYHTAHKRVKNKMGKADIQDCVDCGGPANQWSYDHADINELRSEEGPYSLSEEHYQPRCFSCHKKFDLGRE